VSDIEAALNEIFVECAEIVEERGKVYGPIEDSIKRISGLWSARLGLYVKPSQVCHMMADLKYARSEADPSHHDNATDGVNYTGIGYCLSEKGL
jgi:hypothetical protein